MMNRSILLAALCLGLAAASTVHAKDPQVMEMVPTGASNWPTTGQTLRGTLVESGALAVACVTPPVTPCLNENACNGRFGVGDKKVRYLRNYALKDQNSAVKRAIIIVHGVNRTVKVAFEAAVDAALKAQSDGNDPCAPSDTIILAPLFQNDSDTSASDELYWKDSAWSKGNQSINSGSKFSSYAVADDLVAAVANKTKFPNLTEIIIAGHSAGGQFAHRYAAGNRSDGKLRSGLSMRYVAANPSSYLYLNGWRPTPQSAPDDPDFVKPVTCPSLGNCPALNPSFAGIGWCLGYNTYKYGLVDLNSYMAATTNIPSLYKSRKVAYLLGEADTFQNGNMDNGCEAQYQGQFRFDRGLRFWAFMNTFFAGHQHELYTVPNVDHDPHAMFTSDQGVEALFGPVPPPILTPNFDTSSPVATDDDGEPPGVEVMDEGEEPEISR